MRTTRNSPTQYLAGNRQSIDKARKGVKVLTQCYKLILLFSIIFFSNANVKAQKGLFMKLSLGPGYTMEYSGNIGSGFTITKNHAIGWGITDKFAVHIGEFGSLVWQKVGDYNYINLDAFGLGFCYRTPIGIKISILGAYSKVSFCRQMVASFW